MINTIMNRSAAPKTEPTTKLLSSGNVSPVMEDAEDRSASASMPSSTNPSSMPSTIASDKSVGLGSTSLTPIDLTRSNSQSTFITISHSNATSHTNSNSSSPIVPKLVSSAVISDRKRRYYDTTANGGELIDSHMRKRQKLDNGTAFGIHNTPMSLLNLHAQQQHYNNNNATNMNINNPLSTLQQQLLGGKRQSIYNNTGNNMHTSNNQTKMDVTLVQLVNYLKSQFAKLQQNQKLQQRASNTSMLPSSASSATSGSSSASSLPPTQQHYIPKQQVLMNMMANGNNTKTALLQSILNLKLKQQQQQQQNLLNAMGLNGGANNGGNVLPIRDSAASSSSVFSVSNSNNNNNNNDNNNAQQHNNAVNNGANGANQANPHNNLAKLMANFQNIQNINHMNPNTMNHPMNMLLQQNHNQTPPNCYSTLGSTTSSTSPKKNNQKIEIVTLLSDDDDAGNNVDATPPLKEPEATPEETQTMNYIHTNHPLKQKKKSSKTKHKDTKTQNMKRKRRNNKKHKNKQMIATNSDLTDIEYVDNRKRKRSPSATSTISDTLSHNASDESFKAYNINAATTQRRTRRKRMCNLDKEFDEEERLIKYREDMMHLKQPVSGNAYIVAYAESLHLDDMKVKHNECFPILRQMPRSALIKYCDYYKLRHSKRSKDNRLLQIVTKHFILHNREKNNDRSIEDLENDLFWHSVCWNVNNDKENNQRK